MRNSMVMRFRFAPARQLDLHDTESLARECELVQPALIGWNKDGMRPRASFRNQDRDFVGGISGLTAEKDPGIAPA
jgi:hypothetical protein